MFEVSIPGASKLGLYLHVVRCSLALSWRRRLIDCRLFVCWIGKRRERASLQTHFRLLSARSYTEGCEGHAQDRRCICCFVDGLRCVTFRGWSACDRPRVPLQELQHRGEVSLSSNPSRRDAGLRRYIYRIDSNTISAYTSSTLQCHFGCRKPQYLP